MSGSQFDFKGAGYLFPRLTEGDKKLWLLRCNAKALANLDADRQSVADGFLDYETYAQHAKQINAWVVTRWFHFDAEGGDFWWKDREARVELFWICLRRANPEAKPPVTLDLVKQMGEELMLTQWKFANASPTQPAGSAGGDSPASTSPPATECGGDSSASTS